MDRQTKGRMGEDAVCAELIKNGHRIIERNFRKSFGEIDIISQLDRFIVFTEVKTRQTKSMVSGVEAVNYSKRRKIILTADFYLCNIYPGLMTRPKLQPRYDIAEVTITRGEQPTVLRIDILENAFSTDGIYTLY
ncbi:MAG: YraN family protein [Oscillospiraceae bacterium]|nr:YraN family protein [Oscillospiraceae bacterium]